MAADGFGRFTSGQLYDYISEARYPEDWNKSDKQALRKRAKFFQVKGSNLYYIGGPGKRTYYCCCYLSQRSVVPVHYWHACLETKGDTED